SAFAVAPAGAASQPQLVEGVRSGGGQTGAPVHRARIRESLVVAELAAALILMMGAGLLARSLLQLLAIDPGFRPDHIVGVSMGRLANSAFLQGHGRSGSYEVLLNAWGRCQVSGRLRSRLACPPEAVG